MSEMGDDQDEVLLERWGIPASWVWERLGKVCVVASGGTPDTKDETNFANGTIPWITPADLSGYREKSISHGDRNITQKGLDESSAVLVPKGTVLFSSRAPIGYVVIASNPVTTNQGFKNFIPPPQLASDYLYFYLQRAKQIAVELASGTTFLEISAKRIAQIPLALPPLPEQHRIVEKIEELFSDLDAGVASLERARANLKRYRASVLKSAVEGRLTEEWRKEHPQAEDGRMLLSRILRERREKWERDQLLKFKQKGKEPPKNWEGKYEEPSAPDTSELPELPEGWVWATVEQVTDNHDGHRVPLKSDVRDTRSGQYPYYGASGVIDDIDDYLFDGEYLLIAEDGANLLSRSTPIAFMATGRFWVNNHAHVVQAWGGVPLQYLSVFLNATNLALFITGTAQPKLTQASLNKICLPLPPLAEQEQIVALVEERLSQIDSAEKTIDSELIRSKRLRQSILKRAFEGKLVPQDPKDEPASVLLERIKASRDAEQPTKKAKKVKAR